jgi:hypothetical protein
VSEEALHVVGRGSLVLVSVAFQKVEPADAGTYGIEHLVVRLVYSLLAGAVPCKIDRSYFREGVDIPNVFPSARSFQTKV